MKDRWAASPKKTIYELVTFIVNWIFSIEYKLNSIVAGIQEWEEDSSLTSLQVWKVSDPRLLKGVHLI